jgi:membrane-bound ClpP family serine protease
MATQKKTGKGAQKSVQNSVQEEREARMPLGRRNYVLMLIGLGIIIVGFLLMAGGGSDDPAVFNERMFSFRRITLAPIVVIAGFVFEIYAIMSRRK